MFDELFKEPHVHARGSKFRLHAIIDLKRCMQNNDADGVMTALYLIGTTFDADEDPAFYQSSKYNYKEFLVNNYQPHQYAALLRTMWEETLDTMVEDTMGGRFIKEIADELKIKLEERRDD